jgi:hypothetical protein
MNDGEVILALLVLVRKRVDSPSKERGEVGVLLQVFFNLDAAHANGYCRFSLNY